MHVLNIPLSHWVSNEVWASTIMKLCVILQKYVVIYDTDLWYRTMNSSSIWNWTSQVLTWTLSWVKPTKPTYAFSSRNEGFKWIPTCKQIFSRRKVAQTARIRSRTTGSRQQVFGRSLPCSQRCCLSQQEAGSRKPSDQLCKMKEM